MWLRHAVCPRAVFSLLTGVRSGLGDTAGGVWPCRETVLRGRGPACLAGPRPVCGRRDDRLRET